MGWYINPPSMSKERWLTENGQRTDGPAPITETHLPVCLVNNGPFTAAAICPHEREVQAFASPDGRPKIWFSVSRQSLADNGFYQE